MLTVLDLEQNNVLALRLEGKFDHKSFVEIAKNLNEEFAHHDHIRLYFELPHITGMDFRVIWDSLVYSMKHLREYISKVDRIAVVSDQRWLRRLTEMENKLIAGISEKAYTFDEKEQALAWVKEFTPNLTM